MKPNVAPDQARNCVPPRNAVPKILIIGYGNPLRGDDALGPQVADELTERFGDDPQVAVQTVHQLTLDLAETLANFGQVILIDARDADPVGEIYRQKVQPTQRLPQPFSHYLDPAELLGVCQILYGVLPEMILTGINARNFEVGVPISVAVQARIPVLVDQIANLIKDRRKENWPQ
jgi:hydrogenase maturation protease